MGESYALGFDSTRRVKFSCTQKKDFVTVTNNICDTESRFAIKFFLQL